ncbi:MAG: protein translocase subunit SecD [Patescibacteria group bacterium]
MRKKVWLTFAGIVVLTVVAGFIDYPSGPDIKIGTFFREVKVHLGLDLLGGTNLVYDADTSQIEESDKAAALEGVRDVIENRVNAFGVSEPFVQTNQAGSQWRIIVELAGITNISEAIQMIGETPLLEFKEEVTVEPTEEEKTAIITLNEESKKQAESVLALATAPGADFGALANEYSQDPGNKDADTGEQRGGDLGFFTRDMMVPEFANTVFDQAIIGEVYPQIVETEFGYHIIKKTAIDGDQAQASHILFSKQSTEGYTDFANTELSGKNLSRSAVAFDPNTNEPQVSLEFDTEGKELFSQITERNVNKIVGIYLDGSPISLPRVNEPIRDGNAVISGSFSLEEAKLLAQRLNAGALPVPITLVSQQNIGATLGEQSIQKSFFAGLVGLILVALFMIIYYRLPGLLSVLALIVYALLILALFKLIPITLTLAGIAGFILSIGMAVDANVLIFERSREELRTGKPLKVAVEEGFNRAWPSIRDSNISSIITCIILAWFGTSIMKGFAITLGIGVVVSMFSAITITRTFLRLSVSQWLEKHPHWFSWSNPALKSKLNSTNV